MARRMRVLVLLLVGTMALTVSFDISNAQEKQKIPVEFFTGKWAGAITTYTKNLSVGSGPWAIHGRHIESGKIEFFLVKDDAQALKKQFKDLYGIEIDPKSLYPSLDPKLPFEGKAVISGMYTRAHQTQHYCEECRGKDYNKTKELSPIVVPVQLIYVGDNSLRVNFENLPKDYYNLIGSLPPLSIIKHKTSAEIKVDFFDFEFHAPLNENVFERKVVGSLYRIERLKKSFPKDIKPDEPIKTDKKTQLEITMPSKDVIKIAQNTEAVIRSESLIQIVKGKIHSVIKKLQPKTKFEVKTPTSGFSVRGTEYTVEVEDDGTTTVVVLDGEIEFSDKENKKMVIVKKNQKSVVKPGALPTVPEEIDPEKILNWWK